MDSLPAEPQGKPKNIDMGSLFLLQGIFLTKESKWGLLFLKKLEIELPYDPAIPLLGIHTKETRTERDTCTLMFIAALFTIARTWKQPRGPSTDKRQNCVYGTSALLKTVSTVPQSCL